MKFYIKEIFNLKKMKISCWCCMHKTYFVRTYQGSQFRTVPAGTVGIYRTGTQIGTDNPPVSYWKKYRPDRPYTSQFRAIPAGTKKVFYFLFFIF